MKISEMGPSILRYCLAFTAMVLFACGSFAQSTTDGAIGGAVTDPSGAVVPGATVTSQTSAPLATSTVTTDGSGRYLIGHLQPGIYSLEISHQRLCGLQGHQHHRRSRPRHFH